LAGDQAQHRDRHVADQLGPDRLPDGFSRRRLDPGRVKRGAQPRDPRRGAVVAFADQQHVAVGGIVDDDAGGRDRIGRKDHRADDPLFGHRRPQGAAGIEKAEIRRWRVIGGKPDVVPPGNAVLGKHHGSIVAQQRLQTRHQAGQGVGFQGADHDILRPQRRRIVGRLYARRELGGADPEHQASGPRGFEVRAAHHAGDLVPGPRQPHRQMAADSAGAENAYPHRVVVRSQGRGSRLPQIP
jgi:hypothetical protein